MPEDSGPHDDWQSVSVWHCDAQVPPPPSALLTPPSVLLASLPASPAGTAPFTASPEVAHALTTTTRAVARRRAGKEVSFGKGPQNIAGRYTLASTYPLGDAHAPALARRRAATLAEVASPSMCDSRHRAQMARASDTKPLKRRSWLALAVVIAVGIIAFSPALRAPFWLDDYAHISMVAGTYPAHRGPTELYDFVSSADRGVLIERGVLPWWTDPRLELRFFRPLASALLYFEHRLLGDAPGAMHAVSFAWWLAALFAAHALYRRLMPARVALIAAAIFALAPCHAVPIGWVANREVLLSLVFGALGLAAHVTFRSQGTKKHAALAGAWFAASLASGEYGFAFAGYVLAFELFRRGPIFGRVAALCTFAAPASLYAASRIALGYGTAGSGFYLDPIRQPLRFVAAAPARLTGLLLDGWLTAETDRWGDDLNSWALGVLLVVCAVVIAGPLIAAVRALPEEARASVKSLFLGSILALLPTLAVKSSMRLVGASVLGIAPLVAAVVAHAWLAPRVDGHCRVGVQLRWVAALLAFAHFVHAPLASWMASRNLNTTASEFAARAAWLRDRLSAAPSTEIIIARGGWQSALFGSLSIAPRRPLVARWRPLVMANHTLMLRRDAHTLELIIPHGRGFFPAGDEDLFRAYDAPLADGDETAIGGMRVTVLDAGTAGPARLRFVFDRPLEDASLTWLTELSDRYRALTPPAQGFGERLDP